MSIGALSQSAHRMEAVDFSIPYIYSPMTFMLSTQFAYKASPTKFTNFMHFATIALICFVISAFVANKIASVLRSKVSSASDVVWFIVQQFLQKGLDELDEPESRAIRTLITTWLISGLLTFLITSGSIVAAFARTRPSPIATLDDLAQAEAITPIVQDETYYAQVIKTPGTRAMRALSARTRYTTYRTVYDLVTDMADKPLAFIDVAFSMSCAAHQVNSKKFYLPEPSQSNTLGLDYLAMAFPKSSPLRAPIDRVIRRLLEIGAVESFQATAQLKSSNNKAEFDSYVETPDFEILTFSQLYIVYATVPAAVIVCIITAMCERVRERRQLRAAVSRARLKRKVRRREL